MILEARDLRHRYGAYVALDGVSLSIRENEFVSIIGPNGAGKSTLINVLTGALPPAEGRVRFKGRDIGGIGPVALARLGMARSFQLVQIFPDLTVLETLEAAVVSRLGRGLRLFASLRGDRAVRAEALEVAELFGPSGYFWPWMQATFENWQSEFLQLFTMAVLTAFLIHKGSTESKDGNDELLLQITAMRAELREMKEAQP